MGPATARSLGLPLCRQAAARVLEGRQQDREDVLFAGVGWIASEERGLLAQVLPPIEQLTFTRTPAMIVGERF